MAVFPTTLFSFSTRYPESGSRVQLGGSYQWDSGPEYPDQRIFSLTLPGMQYFFTPGGSVISLTISLETNMAVLEKFYNDHKRAKAFTFTHPVYGALNCKFNLPLVVPKGIKSGNGMLEPVELELIEIP